MARIRIAGTSGSSENTIVFSPAGGHSHNGQNSSLIDSTAYSVYDFSPTFVGTEVNPDRAVRQENNRIAFEDVIKRVVNNSVLAPAGIRLEQGSLNGSLIIANTITANQLAANTITADEIAAGTITATQLASNIVLINNRITSQNWNGTIQANGTIFSNDIGSAGWAITNTHAVFDSTLIRGSIAAASVSTPGIDLNSDGSISSTNFNVTATGNVTAVNANITGTITSGSGTIGGWTIDTARIYGGSTYLYSNGSIAIGATTIAANGQITNGGYTLSNTGVLTATGANINGIITSNSGNIGGWAISSNAITAGSTTLSSAGSVTIGATTIAANGQITNGGYTLSAAGALSATGANITGTVTATDGGQIGDFFITSGALSASSLGDAIAGTSASMSLGVDGLIKTRIDVGSIFGTPYYTETYINRRESSGGIYIIGTASGSTAATEITSSFISTGTVFINGNSVATSLAGKAASDHLHDSRYVNADGDTMSGILYGTGIDMSGNLRYGGQVYSDEVGGYAEFGAVGSPDTIGGRVFRINQVSTLWSRSLSTTGSRPVFVNDDSTLFCGATVSSLRYKNSIVSSDINTKAFLELDVVDFYYNDEFYENPLKRTKELGVIAEQVHEKGLLDLVRYDEIGRPDGLNENKIPFYLLKACIDQQAEIEDLKTRIQALEGV